MRNGGSIDSRRKEILSQEDMLSAQFRFRSVVSLSLKEFEKAKFRREAPGWPEASQVRSSALHAMSGNPLLGLKRHIHQRLQVIQTE